MFCLGSVCHDDDDEGLLMTDILQPVLSWLGRFVNREIGRLMLVGLNLCPRQSCTLFKTSRASSGYTYASYRLPLVHP